MTQRNCKIAIAVLQGYTLKEVGIVYNISGNRVRQIFYNTAILAARDDVFKILREGKYWKGLMDLREHKYTLIAKIKRFCEIEEAIGE
jgi:hypothetical protein